MVELITDPNTGRSMFYLLPSGTNWVAWASPEVRRGGDHDEEALAVARLA